MHDQAATVSVDIEVNNACTLRFGDIVEAMQAIAKAAEDAGGIIGHIKAFARQGDEFAHASVTASDIEPTCEGLSISPLGHAAEIQLVAIVMLVEQEDLLAICKDVLANRE